MNAIALALPPWERMGLMKWVLIVVACVAFVSGCAHVEQAKGPAPRLTPSELFAQACLPGKGLTEAHGVVSMKVKSHDGSGQFSGNVRAEAPDVFNLEVLQPLGGTWATVTIHGNDYTIDVPGKPEQGRHGFEVWGGIPLRFATNLFLGQIPCPTHVEMNAASAIIVSSPDGKHDQLVVGPLPSTNDRYTYRFREEAGSPWPEALRWESSDRSGPIVVDFKFDDPEKNTRSPLKWEAKSNRGEVKVRWRDRNHVP
jgi:hypothetical protein